MAQDARQPLQGGNPLFRQQQPGKQQPPQHKIPRRAVPQPRKHPHGENIQHPPPTADPAAAHGDIHIVPKPAAKADMPPPPELRDASRKVGVVEILHKMEPQHPPQADGHVGIAGKVEVNVQGKGHGVHPVKQDGFFAALAEQLNQQGKIIRKDNLFPQPHQKPPQTHRRVFPAVLPVLQLPGDVCIADDGPRNQLGKQGDIRAEVDEVLLCRDAAAIDVDGVAQALEGVKADADGQRKMKQRNFQAGDGVQTADEEVRVLENPQQPHADDDGRQQPELFPLPGAFDAQAADVAQHDGEHHQGQQPQLPPAVKNQAGKEQNGVFPLPGREKIHRQHRREEII